MCRKHVSGIFEKCGLFFHLGVAQREKLFSYLDDNMFNDRKEIRLTFIFTENGCCIAPEMFDILVSVIVLVLTTDPPSHTGLFALLMVHLIMLTCIQCSAMHVC